MKQIDYYDRGEWTGSLTVGDDKNADLIAEDNMEDFFADSYEIVENNSCAQS